MTAQNLPVAARCVQDYESSTSVAEEQTHLDTCLLQAISLRAAQKMLLLDALVWAAEEISESGKAPAKNFLNLLKRAKKAAGSRSNAPKGRKTVSNKKKR